MCSACTKKVESDGKYSSGMLECLQKSKQILYITVPFYQHAAQTASSSITISSMSFLMLKNNIQLKQKIDGTVIEIIAD